MSPLISFLSRPLPKTLTGSLHLIGIFFVSFPLIFSFFCFLLHISFHGALALAIPCSALASFLLFRKIFRHSLPIPFFSLGAALAFTLFYLVKVCALIYDAVFPTGLLGMVNQIARGRFPASFIAFPEVPANYHQGFVTLAAMLKILTGLPTPTTLQLTILCGVFYFIFWCAELLRHSWQGLLVLLIGLVCVASFPKPQEWLAVVGPVGFLEYVTWGAMFLSTSFAWAMPAFILFLLLLQNKKDDWEKPLLLSFLLIAISLFNATLYSLGLIVFGIYIFLLGAMAPTQRPFRPPHLLLPISALALAWLAPQFLPTALLRGPTYEKVHVTLRHLTLENLHEWQEYGRLSGGILILGFFLLLQKDFFKKNKLICTSALVCFFFPLIFELTNVNIWDNFHKFALLNQFFFLLLFCLTLKDFNYLKKRWLMLVIFVVLSSSLAVHDNLKYRANWRPMIYAHQPPPSREVTFLSSIPGDVMLYGYKHDMYTHDALSEVANHAGVFLRTSYYDNFLLSKDLEDDYNYVKDWSTNPHVFADVVEKRLLQPRVFIAVEKSDLAEFKKNLASGLESKLQFQEFDQWFLISYLTL